jgi:hypothetical protein
VLRSSQAHNANRPTRKFELKLGQVASRPTVNQHDCLFFRKGGSSLSRRVAFGLLTLGKSLCGHVVIHHGTFLQLVPNVICMVGAGCLEKLLKAIGGLLCLTLEIVLSNGSMLPVGVTGLLVVVILVTASGDHDSSGSLLWPLSCHLWCPSWRLCRPP